MNYSDELLKVAIKAALEAGAAINKIYKSKENYGIESKSNSSPLTEADTASHSVIISHLQQFNLPILSEEGPEIPYETRKGWEYFWMVDPLDGTKEFINGNGEFTVNLSLIKYNQPVMGVIYIPVSDKLYYAVKGSSAWSRIKNNKETKISAATFKSNESSLKIVGSRSHMNDKTSSFISKYKDAQSLAIGSSLKFMLLAEGKAHIYPRFAPTMEWDTAAAHVILEEAGGKIFINGTDRPLVYNKPELTNPEFLAMANCMD